MTRQRFWWLSFNSGIMVLWIALVLNVGTSLEAVQPGSKDAANVSKKQRPNVMVVLVDDLGWSDVGCYGGEINTPTLDSLAAGGVRYTQFYNTGRCWPTRAAILTGYYAQQVRCDRMMDVKGAPGRGQRPDWGWLLPKHLTPLGYRSYHSGKWHIDRLPVNQGFDKSYLLGDQARFFSPKHVRIDDVKQPAIKRGTGFYGTTAIVDQTVSHLKDHAANHADTPFFYYLAFTAPHFPLHALPEDIAKYKGKFDAGWDEHRKQRWAKIQKLGLVDSAISDPERKQGAPYQHPDQVQQFGPGEVALPLEWDAMNETQQNFQAMKMELHAAMVDRVDVELGRVIKQLKEMKAFDNTLIMFLSDNGASAELMVRDDGHDPDAEPGSAATHLCLGPGWSTTCNTPFRKHKTWNHEGGIRTPMIAHWPNGINGKGAIRKTPGHVVDLVPTIMELAGGQFKKVDPKQPDLPGRSLVPSLVDDKPVDREFIWWHHDGHAALRMDDWKLVRTKTGEWELFNLAQDAAETVNLVGAEPRKASEMRTAWTKARDQYIKNSLYGDPKPRIQGDQQNKNKNKKASQNKGKRKSKK